MSSAIENIPPEQRVAIGEQNLEGLSEYFEKKAIDSSMDESVMTKHLMDRMVFGEMDFPVKKGAIVISVDGETYDRQAMPDFQKGGYIGRFFKVQPLSPYLLRVRFTTTDGFFYKGTRRELEKKVENPLSKKGFVVPSMGGYKVLDGGKIILLSRSGMFRSEDGYKQAREYLSHMLKERRRVQKYQEMYEETIIKLETSEEDTQDLYLNNVYLTEKLRQYSANINVMKRALNVAQGISDNLDSKVQYSEDVLEHMRRQMQEELSKFQRSVSDVLMLAERIEIDDSLRARRMQHPALTKEFERQIVEKWEKEGITQDNESEKLRRELVRMREELNRKEERDIGAQIGEQPPEGIDGDEESDFGTEEYDSSEGYDEGEGTTQRPQRHGALSKGKSIVRKGTNAIKDGFNKVINREDKGQEDEDEQSGGSSEEEDETSGDED